MPYIKQEYRKEIAPLVKEVIALIPEDVSTTKKSNLFREYVDRLTYSPGMNIGFIKSTDSKDISDRIKNLADRIKRIIVRDNDYGRQSGEYNYAIFSVCYGIMGGQEPHPMANYALRCMLDGVLYKIRNYYLRSDDPYYLMISGVLSGVLKEKYRRLDSVYEDQKIQENGDIFPLIS